MLPVLALASLNARSKSASFCAIRRCAASTTCACEAEVDVLLEEGAGPCLDKNALMRLLDNASRSPGA
jgi:hypothetical protein